MISKKRLEAIASAAHELGVDTAAASLGVSRETVRREVRRAKNAENHKKPIEQEDAILRKLRERFSPQELAAIANGQGLKPRKPAQACPQLRRRGRGDRLHYRHAHGRP